MANYTQPNSTQGTYTPSLTTAVCPLDGLAGRRFGSTRFSFRCDGGHQFDSGASAVMPTKLPLLQASVADEIGAAMHTDVLTGRSAKP
jgi:hypothetical protein